MHGLLFHGLQVFDGATTLGRTSVLVEGDRITGVGDELDVPSKVTVVPGAGHTLLPGLIDAHVHVTGGALARGLRFGVTTQLDMFADPAVLAAARTEATRTDVSDLRSAGIGATAPGGHPTELVHMGLFGEFPTVASAPAADAFVAARAAEGIDYLKVFASSVPGETRLPTLDSTVVAALIAAAHRRDLLAVVHATDVPAALAAIRAGADGLVHLPFDRPLDDEFVSTVAVHDVFVVPTLTMLESFCQEPGGRALARDPLVAARLDATSRDSLRQVMSPPPGTGYAVRNAAAAISALLSAGVDVLAGTDAGAPGTAHGASLHRELELLVLAGLPAERALAAATSIPARRFGLADRGWIEPGARADLIVVRGDPTAVITSSRDIVAVCREGRLLTETDHRPARRVPAPPNPAGLRAVPIAARP
jgi:imidazolonepropionase-like amidohydrolase